MTGNNIILRLDKDGVTFDLPIESTIPLRLDMSTLESGEIGKLFSVGSQQFTVPGTKDSNKFFEFAFNPATDDSVAMYNSLPASVLLNGDIILEGQMQLLEAISSDDGYVDYRVIVFDTPITLESTLQGKLIKDADWSAYSHTLTSQSLVDSWSDNLLSGSVYYPLAHYGFPDGQSASYAAIALGQSQSTDATISNPLTPMQLEQFLPAIKLKDTLDVIFDQAGFSYTGSFTETADFNKLYILNKPQEGLGPVTSGSTEATFTAFTTGSSIQSYTIQTSANQWRRVKYPDVQSDPVGAFTAECIGGVTTLTTGSKFTAQATGEHSFDVQLSALNPTFGTGATATIKISLMQGSLPCTGAPGSGGSGAVIGTDEISIDNTYGINVFNLSIQKTVTLTQGQDVWLWVEYFRTAGTGGNTLDVGYFYDRFQCTSAPDAIDGATIDMGLQFNPDTKSLDLLKGIIQQFNLVMTPIVNNRSTIGIYQFDEWLREGEIKDWSSKYDTAKRIGVSHTIADLEADIYLKNQDDEDRFSKQTKENDPNYQYGTLRLIADNNISQGEQTIGDYFAPVVLGGATGVSPLDNETPSTRVDVNTNFVYPHLYKFDNSQLKSYSSKPRIGYKVTNQLLSGQAFYIGFPFNELEVTGSYATIANVSDLPVTASVSNDLHFNNTYSTFTDYPYNLNSGVNSYTNYYETYLDSLYWLGSKKLTIDLYFDPTDYKDIRLNDRILIKGQAYRINKISGFNLTSRDVVTVELIKLYPEYWQVAANTPPTTGLPVYYALRKCSDGSEGWISGQETGSISLSMDSRVTAPGFPTPVYTVVGLSSIGTSVGNVTDTGELGCLYEPSVGAMYPSGMVTSSLVHFYNAWDTRNTNNIWKDSWGSGPTGSVAAGFRNSSTDRKNMTLASFYTDFTSSQAIATASYYSQSLTKPPVEFESVFNIATTANNDYPYTILTFGSYPRPANFTQGLWYMGPNDLANLPNATAFPDVTSYRNFYANRDGKVVMLGTYDEEVPGVGNPPRQAIYTAYPESNFVVYHEYGGNSTIQQSAEGDPSDFSLTALKLGAYEDYNALKPRTDRLQLRVNDAVYQLTTPTWAASDIYVPADGINVLGKSYFTLSGQGNPPGTISYPDDMIYQAGSAFMYHAIYDRLLTDDEIEQNYQAFLTSSQVIVT